MFESGWWLNYGLDSTVTMFPVIHRKYREEFFHARTREYRRIQLPKKDTLDLKDMINA